MTRRVLTCVAALSLVLAAHTASASASGSASFHVVGGQTVTTAEYPWQAAVVTAGSGGAFNRQFCGGSLITSRIVLTAAHCVYDQDPDCDNVADCLLNDGPGDDATPKIDPDEVNVILGRTTLSFTDGVEHAIQDVAYQDGYNPNFNPPQGVPSNDVGYLVLTDAFPTTETPIKIAGADETALWAPGVFVEVTGWGTTSFGGSKSNTLRAGSVPMVSDSECLSSYDGYFDGATMVCAGYMEGGVDTCQGDSGGPLQSAIQPIGPDTYRLVGITSWGEGCAEPGFPGVYTRVAETALRDAIVTKVADLENNQAPPITPNENIVGAGGVSVGGGPKYPPPPPPPVSNPVPPVIAPPASDPFAKCKKVRNKKKKKKCTQRVRATLNG